MLLAIPIKTKREQLEAPQLIMRSVFRSIASKNVINLSPNAKSALNSFQCPLDALGKTEIPGIGVVTAALLHVVKGVQVGACLFRSFILA